jgi:CRP/FNR family transcriptional regulator
MRSNPRVLTIPADHVCASCDVRLQTFCGVLQPKELEAFRCQGSVSTLAAGQSLFHEGDQARMVFNLTRGTLKLYKLLADGRRQVTGFLFPGDFLGLTVEDEHAFSAEALEPIEFCCFTRPRFEAFIDAHPRMERELYRMAAHELAAAQEQMVLLGRKTARERLASFLLALASRAEETDAPGDTDVVHLTMSRIDIGDYLGLTKETVSRTFTSLKSERIIRLASDNVVQILDRERLESIADAADG